MGAVSSTDYNEFLHTKEDKGNAALVSHKMKNQNWSMATSPKSWDHQTQEQRPLTGMR